MDGFLQNAQRDNRRAEAPLDVHDSSDAADGKSSFVAGPKTHAVKELLRIARAAALEVKEARY